MQRIWKGNYCYLNEEGNEIDPFDFEITANLIASSFEGTAIEGEFSKVSEEPIYVKGFFDNDVISFVKTYPFGWDVDQGGEVQLHLDKPGHDVTYFGRLNPETLFWEGEWEIESESQLAPKNSEIILSEYLFGNWKMKLVTEL